MKKSFLLKVILLLTLVLVCMLTASVNATNVGTETDPYVASNVEELQGYLNLGGHIKLTANIDVGEFTGDKFVIQKDIKVVLDLNGYTLGGENNNEKVNASLIKNKGTLTINDNSANKDGKITMGGNAVRLGSNGIGIYTINNFGTLTINNGTIENTGKTDVPYPINNYSGESNVLVTINGGNIISNRGTTIRGYAASLEYTNDIIVNGGNITGVTSGIWLQQAGSKAYKATLTVNDGNITGNGYNAIFASVYNNKDTSKVIEINIKGGNITNNHENQATVSFEEFGGGALDKATINLNISGGTFTNLNKKGRVLFNTKYTNLTNDNIKITGGTFNKIIPSEYIALDGNINIKLTEDINIETTIIPTGSKVTIDLNGHTISGTQKVFDVKGAELTITGKGTIKETQPNYAPIHITGDSTNEAVINVGKDVTLEGWSGIMTSKDTVRDAKITIKMDGKINAVNDMGGGVGSGIYINGNLVNKDKIKVELSSTTEINSTGDAIYGAGYADWTINGSTLSGVTTAIGIKSGNFDINNAIVTATGKDDRPTEGYGNGINPSGAAIQIESNDGYAGNIKIDIDGGIYKSENGVAFYEYLSEEENKETKVISLNITNGEFISAENKPVFAVSGDFTNKITKFIKGGTFTSDVSEYLAEGCYAGKQENGTYLVKEIVDISKCEVTGIQDKTYTGEALTQDIVVKYDGNILKNGTDYIVKYENNKKIGTATLTIIGKGYYKGTITKTFKINPILIEKATIIGISNKTYTGKGLTQNIIVKLDGKTLINGTDYIVSYSNNTEPGKATITIIGKGIYEGKITKIFLITPKKLTGLKVSEQTTSKIKLSWSKHEGVTGYKVYSYNYSKNKWEYEGKTTGTSYTVKSLKAGTTYKYRVRAYKNIDDVQYFGDYTTSLKTATKPKTPSVKVKAGDKKLTLTWNKISGATGYEIYMATSKNGKYEKIKTISNNKTFKYTKSGLKTNKKYYFKVRAYRTVDDKKVYSSYSKVQSATTKKVYTVKKGDTLYRIAKNNKTTVAKLVKINNLKKAILIRVGLRLLLN